MRVGHHQRIGRGWQTGPRSCSRRCGAVAAVDVRGGGPGTRETDALDPRNLVDRIHAVCLTGGSAYGLGRCRRGDADLERGSSASASVRSRPRRSRRAAAVIFDLGRGGRFGTVRRPSSAPRAASSAGHAGIGRGSVGAGTGARGGGMQGGVGMASMVVDAGRPRCHGGGAGGRQRVGFGDRPRIGHRGSRTGVCGARHRRRAAWAAAAHRRSTRDPADEHHDRRRGHRRHRSHARGRPARPICPRRTRPRAPPGAPALDGDTVFGLATGRVAIAASDPTLGSQPASRTAALNGLFAAAADVFATACTDAVLAAPRSAHARLPRPLPERVSGGAGLVGSRPWRCSAIPAAMRAWSQRAERTTQLAVVPTMGALARRAPRPDRGGPAACRRQ